MLDSFLSALYQCAYCIKKTRHVVAAVLLDRPPSNSDRGFAILASACELHHVFVSLIGIAVRARGVDQDDGGVSWIIERLRERSGIDVVVHSMADMMDPMRNRPRRLNKPGDWHVVNEEGTSSFHPAFPSIDDPNLLYLLNNSDFHGDDDDDDDDEAEARLVKLVEIERKVGLGRRGQVKILEDCEALNRENAAHMKQLDEETTKRDGLQRSLVALREVSSRVSEEHKALLSANKASMQQLVAVRAERDLIKDELVAVSASIAAQTKVARKTADDASRELSDVRKKQTATDRALASSRESTNLVKKELEAASVELDGIRSDLTETLSAKNGVLDELADARRELSDAQAVVEEHLGRLADVRNRATELEADLVAAERANESIGAATAAARESSCQLRRDHDVASADAVRLGCMAKAAFSERERLSKEIDMEHAVISGLRDALLQRCSSVLHNFGGGPVNGRRFM